MNDFRLEDIDYIKTLRNQATLKIKKAHLRILNGRIPQEGLIDETILAINIIEEYSYLDTIIPRCQPVRKAIQDIQDAWDTYQDALISRKEE